MRPAVNSGSKDNVVRRSKVIVRLREGFKLYSITMVIDHTEL